MSISSRLRLVVEQSGLSITDVAAKCEIPYSSLQNYLRGEREPRSDALVAICTHLNISADWLLTGQGSMYRNAEVQASGLNRRQTAILELFEALDGDAQREIQTAVEEKKRLIDLERRVAALEAAKKQA